MLVLATGLAAGCGGPAGMLHDTLDDAAAVGAETVDAIKAGQADFHETISQEIEPCADLYRVPENLGRRPRFQQQVPRPEALEVGDQFVHDRNCSTIDRQLSRLRESYDNTIRILQGFEADVEAMHTVVSDELSDAEIESITEDLEVIAAARPDEDTLHRRYDSLLTSLIETSPYLREVSVVATDDERIFGPLTGPDAGSQMVHDAMLRIDEIIDEHAEAREYRAIANEYARAIYEGPDAER